MNANEIINKLDEILANTSTRWNDEKFKEFTSFTISGLFEPLHNFKKANQDLDEAIQNAISAVQKKDDECLREKKKERDYGL